MTREQLVYSAVFCCCLAFGSCKSEEPDASDLPRTPSGTLVFSLNGGPFNVDAQGQKLTLDLQVDGSWNAETDCFWLTIDKTSGTGSAMLSVICSSNPTKKKREGHITVSSSGIKKQVAVMQNGVPLDTAHYVSHRAVYGNLLKEEKSYLEVTFDKPVTLKERNFGNYMPEMPEYSEDRCTVRQELKAGAIGLNVTGSLSFASDDGVLTKLDLTFSFYDQCFRVGSPDEGYIVENTLLAEDEQSLWISRCRPAELLQVSLVDGNILKRIEMPFTPGVIAHNPYNDKLYVLPYNYLSDLGWANELCVVNPDIGVIEKTISIEPSPNAHPQNPPILPIDLQFTADGMGILVLGEQSSDMLEWRYLDSADDDRLTYSGYDWWEYRFEHVYVGCDHKYVWANCYPSTFHPIYQITRGQKNPREFELDSSFRDYEYEYAGGVMTYMVYHRYHNRVFIATSPGCQCVIDLDTDTYTKTTPAESRGTVAAWDYSHPDRNLVFYVGGLDKNFLLLDMDAADALYYANCIWYDHGEIRGLYHLEKTDRLLVADYYGGIFLIDVSKMRE